MQRSFDAQHWSQGLYATAGRSTVATEQSYLADEAEAWSASTFESGFGVIVGQAPIVAENDPQPAGFAAVPVPPTPAAAPAAVPVAPPAVPVASAGSEAPGDSAPVESSTADIDPRAAAALRLSAVEAAPEQEDAQAYTEQSASRLPAADSAQRGADSREPAWLRVQREAAEMPIRQAEPRTRARHADSGHLPEVAPAEKSAPAPASELSRPQLAPDVQPPAPAASWPPLGASWRIRENPDAPWPGPDAASVPAVVAAQQAPTQAMAEMWVQSSQEVMNRGSVRVCNNCALQVSPAARFCRRCGSQQA